MYKNIIFDIGGVLVDFSPREFLVDRFFNEKLENQLFEITFGSSEWLKLDAGILTQEEAFQIMRQKGKKIGRAFEVDTILTDWYDMLKTKDETVVLLKRLKKRGYRLFYLTNISWDVLKLLAPRKFWNMFEGGIASCEVHLVKPDLRIYQSLMVKYKLSPQECIFIDDAAANARAASQAGILGVQFKNVRTLQKVLRNYGVDTIKKVSSAPVPPAPVQRPVSAQPQPTQRPVQPAPVQQPAQTPPAHKPIDWSSSGK